MSASRAAHTATALRDGRVLVAGGFTEMGSAKGAEVYEPATGAFTAGPPMRLGRYKHAGTSLVLPSGLVLVAGGAPQAELYDPRGNAFALVPGEPRMAGQFSAVASLETGGALITGGYGNGGGPRSAAWLYRPG
jgi:hypothetical protein